MDNYVSNKTAKEVVADATQDKIALLQKVTRELLVRVAKLEKDAEMNKPMLWD